MDSIADPSDVCPQIPRPIYESVFAWAKKATRSPFWTTAASGSDAQGRLFAEAPSELASTAEE